jgi:hypothetical protein
MIKSTTLRHWFFKSNRYILKNSFRKNILIFYLLQYAIVILSIPIIYLVEQLFGEDKDGPNIKGWAMFVTAVIIAPLIETLFAQALAHKVGQYFKLKSTYIILLSASWFGIWHIYSPQYIVFAFALGLVFAYGYYLYQSNFRKAFWFIATVHALHNLTSFLLVYFFE